MAHAHFMLDNLGYKHTLRLCDAAFPLQRLLHEGSSILGYTHIHCLVMFLLSSYYLIILSSYLIIWTFCVVSFLLHVSLPKSSMHLSFLSYAPHYLESHPPFCRQLGNIWRAVEIVKLLTTLFSAVACYLFSFFHHSIVKYPQYPQLVFHLQ
jgi:hypothetical protein